MRPDVAYRLKQAAAPGVTLARRAAGVILFGAVTGGLASLAALAFVASIIGLNDFLLLSPSGRATAAPALVALATLAVPVIGGLVVGGFNRYLLPAGLAQGPPEVIRHAQSGDGRIGLRGGLASAVAALVALGSGASVGQYGPLVHLGGTLGSTIGRWTQGSGQMATVGIGCGVAAAIATAFSAPIAGLLFAHEVVLRHYSLKAFAPITVAATTGYFLNHTVFQREPLFVIEAIPVIDAGDLAIFVLIGILGAGVAVAFMRAVLYAARLARAMAGVPDWLKPAVAGFGVGALALGVPEILGMGTETLRDVLTPAQIGLRQVALILVLKILATALCLGFGFTGGIFSPAILIGTLFGALVGQVLLLVTGGDPAVVTLYAVCGLAAVTSAVIGAPITTILIVFELTRNYELTTAVMVSVVFSSLVSYRLFGRSMFDVELLVTGFDLTYGRDQVVLDDTSIGPWVCDDYVRLAPGTSCREARRRIVAADTEEAQVVADDERYLGVVDLARLDAMLDAGRGDAPIDELVHWPAVVLDTHTSIWRALARVKHFNGHAVPVIGPGRSERLAGVVPEPALIRAHLDTIQRIRDEEHATP